MLKSISPGKPRLKGTDYYGPLLEPLIAAAEAGEPLEPVMTRLVRELGFESFIFAITTDPQPHQESRSYAWTNLPNEWLLEYDRNAYVEVDPRITLTWGRATPLIWDTATLSAEPRVRAFLDRAATYGICSGVTVSFSDTRQPRFGASYNSSITPVPPERRRQLGTRLGDLMLLTAGIHDIFLRSVVLKGLPPGQKGLPLSVRERQCINLAAHGMTSADMGIKLGIAERTVNFHFGNILSKLDALNRQEAIAKAVQLGIVQIEI